MRACATCRAGAWPCAIIFRSASRSSSPNLTIYFFIGVLLAEIHFAFVSLSRIPLFPSSHQIMMDRTLGPYFFSCKVSLFQLFQQPLAPGKELFSRARLRLCHSVGGNQRQRNR